MIPHGRVLSPLDYTLTLPDLPNPPNLNCPASGVHPSAQRFGALYELRYKSDYDLDVTVNQQDVLQALEYMEYIQGASDTTLFRNPSNA